MSVQASVVLSLARTLLNDDPATTWTDNSLFPKLQQAHNELQIKLRRVAAPVMRGSYLEIIPPLVKSFATPPSDLVAPIQLWENTVGGPSSTNILMTEENILPNKDPQPLMNYWSWVKEVIVFIGATTNRQITMSYWRAIPTPVATTDSIGFINGELYLAPRLAAIAAGSVGQVEEMATWTGLADNSLAEVILSNRGRAPQLIGQSVKS